MIVVDTSVVYALADARDRSHGRVREWYEAGRPELATTPLVVAEIDHLIEARAGRRAQRAWRADLVAGSYLVEWWAGAEGEAARVAEKYADLGIGLADASLVVLAHRLHTADVATLDERHFRALRPLKGAGAFRLLPADA